MKVSVLVGSRNRPKVLLRCLESVLKQEYESLEVLVLDDGSAQPFQELILEQIRDARLRFLRVDIPLGVAGGRNLLMKQATGGIFCVIDDDAEFVSDRAVSQIVNTFKNYPDVGILACKIIDYQPELTRVLAPFSQRQRKKNVNLVEEQNLVSYYLGGCHAIQRHVIAKIGYYHNELMFGEEELDLSYRAINARFKVMYQPAIVAHHHPEPSVLAQTSEHQGSELYYHVRNRFYLAYRYLPWIYIFSYLTVWLAVYGSQAIKERTFKEFYNGLISGISWCNKINRIPLTSHTVQYLRTNYGRLWY